MDMTPSPSGLKSKPLLQKQAEVGSLERGNSATRGPHLPVLAVSKTEDTFFLALKSSFPM